MSQRQHLILGIMSGTSLDGADFALCSIDSHDWALRRFWQAPFPRRIRERLHRAAQGAATSWETGQLHHDLGRFYATHAVAGLRGARVEAVGLHGQTIFHHPDRRAPATFQIGEAAWLVEALRAPVVSNFRAADLAAGGQGAPLVTLFHREIFAERGRHVCVNNLGGISNVTSLDWRRGREPRVLAFDSGPANVLLDLATRHFTGDRARFDRGGRRAARGRVIERMLARWLEHDYFAQPPPKSTGRELFGERFFQRELPRLERAGATADDVLATLTEFTAASVARNYELHLPGPAERVVLHGGGAANTFLVKRLAAHLRRGSPTLTLTTCEEYGWPLQSVEPAAFALLAWRRLRGEPGNLPSTTGATRAALLGQVAQP